VWNPGVTFKGLLRISILALIWGSGFLLIKIALRGFSPVQLTFSRLALGALVLLVFMAVARLRLPTDGHTWLHLIVAALLANAIPYTLFGVAELHVDSNLAGAINATTPLWTVLFALATGTESRLTARRWMGMMLGFAGAVVILAPWNTSQVSFGHAVACLAASASYGASYVYMARYLIGEGRRGAKLGIRAHRMGSRERAGRRRRSVEMRTERAVKGSPGPPSPWGSGHRNRLRIELPHHQR
jgi:drug/metabolite transporter (DMT)-like permease